MSYHNDLNKQITFIARVHACLREANEKFQTDFTPANISIRVDIKGTTSGIAGRRNGRLYLRFNPEAIDKHWDEMFNNTVPHEVAHLVCMRYPNLGRDHNAGWKRVCRALGGNDSRCHQMELTRARGPRQFAVYKLPAGESIVGIRQHSKVQKKSAKYRCNITGATVEASKFVRLCDEDEAKQISQEYLRAVRS